MSSISRNRRTLLGAALATAGLATQRHEISGKHKKKKKKCHALTTRCGKRQCCQPGLVCSGGHCETPSTTTTPTPLTEVNCSGFADTSWGLSRRVAQPFVATGTGKIASASFDVYGSDPDRPFGVEIRTMNNGSPTAEVLGTTFVIDQATVPPHSVYTAIATFDPKVEVKPGLTYALVITDVASRGVSFPVQFLSACPLDACIDNAATNDFQPLEDRNLIFAVSPQPLTAE